MSELLIPAGNLEKLKVAALYGANAVYLGGQKFGLRAAADNFTHEELIEGVEFAKARNVSVYVVLNSFLHDKDLDELPEFLKFIEQVGVDAVIVSDLGVIKTVQKHCKLAIHLSTQASCLNIESALLWKEMGVKRVILGRECSVADGGMIKRATGLEVEMFIHGSMCMAFSGNCTISNYTQGRDSNRGGCAHSCRFEYSIFKADDEQKIKSFFMSSKDLKGIEHLMEFLENDIDSVKVEGRMKSHLYAATVSKIYGQALAKYKSGNKISIDDLRFWDAELEKVSHREYADANLIEKADAKTIFNERENKKTGYKIIGHIQDVLPEWIIINVKNTFSMGDTLELLPFVQDFKKIAINEIQSISGEEIVKTKPSTLVKIPNNFECEKYNLLRMRVN